jgi:hypothetical protein
MEDCWLSLAAQHQRQFYQDAIAKIIQYTLDTVQHTDVPSLEAVIANDKNLV